MPQRIIIRFFKMEAASGFVLAAFAVLGFVLANSAYADLYEAVLHTHWPLALGPLSVDLTAEEWIKDGLMTIFFFVVGLELKAEFLAGELSAPRAVVLPAAAALGGMIVPALLYLLINTHGDGRGWPVPVATDIAFATAALVVVAPRIPVSLRIFLLTLAVVDDLGAVVLIAILYTANLDVVALLAMALTLFAMLMLGRLRTPAWLFALGAVLVWAMALKAGVNTSVAGVAAAFAIPLHQNEQLQRALRPISGYLVLPVFALASAGIALKQIPLQQAFSPVPLGIALGLLFGKPVGVLLASYGAIRLRLAKLPAGATHAQFFGVACLCGIGFTMSLYLAALAFPAHSPLATDAQLGVVAGSILALILGTLVLRFAKQSPA